MRKTAFQLLLYGTVGLVSNGIGFLIYLLLTTAWLGPKMAMSLVYIIGVSIGFIGNRKLTFAHRGDSSSAALRFLAAYAMAYMLNFFCMWVAVDGMGIPHYLVQGVNIIVISALLFLAQKYWIFAAIPVDASRLGGCDSTGRKV